MSSESSDTDSIAQRVAALRAHLTDLGLNGFIVPHTDENQSEYLPPAAERLAWITGFTGSAGTAIILENKAVLFVDGRYTLQAQTEVDSALFTQVDVTQVAPAAWLADNADEGIHIAHDPWLTTMADAARLAESCTAAGATLSTVAENPIDLLWSDRPEPPIGAVSRHKLAYAGREVDDKLRDMAQALADSKADATVLVRADSIAWTFNIRGSDTAHNPAPLAFAILRADG
ncbi:MAG: aminopeptidase P family N-terminal domain-containing protein, partial [Alphaproteobacteria bacterium]